MDTESVLPQWSRRSMMRTLLTATAGAGAAILGGCVVAPAPMMEEPGYAPVAPPPPRAEVIPVAPFAGAVWIHGSWGWSGGRYHWAPGHYERPRPGYRYEPRHWVKNGRGQWQERGGRWVR